jgi:hypothetical protein
MTVIQFPAPKNNTDNMEKVKDGFSQYMRSGKWGACPHCPRDSNGAAYPEKCTHNQAGDELFELHNGTLDTLHDLNELLKKK